MLNLVKIRSKINGKRILQTLKENKRLILTVLVLFITADIFLIKESSDLRMFVTLLIYAILVKIFKLKSKLTFIFCLLFLAFMFVSFLTTSTSAVTEKAAVWLVLLMIFGVIQQWIELSKTVK